MLDNDLVWLLGTPADPASDWSWVKPGKVAWEWWNDWNITGVDFKAGVNNDTYKYYIDFASRNGIEYIILDEGWAVNLEADLFASSLPLSSDGAHRLDESQRSMELCNN